MKRLVVDASVAVKWYVPEIHSEAAAKLLSGPYELIAPDLILPEAAGSPEKTGRGRAAPRMTQQPKPSDTARPGHRSTLPMIDFRKESSCPSPA